MEKTETAKLSTLEKTEVPKHKNALEEKYKEQKVSLLKKQKE